MRVLIVSCLVLVVCFLGLFLGVLALADNLSENRDNDRQHRCHNEAIMFGYRNSVVVYKGLTGGWHGASIYGCLVKSPDSSIIDLWQR